jgi:hypothetical protein
MTRLIVVSLALLLALAASATASSGASDPPGAIPCIATPLLSSNLVTPAPTQLTSCIRRCLLNSYFLFGVTGSGATCDDARADLASQLHALANARCASRNPPSEMGMVCLLSQDYPHPCTEESSGTFQVQGNAIYSCSILFC